VPHHVLAFSGGVGGVYAYEGAAKGHDAQGGEEPFGLVLADDGHVLAPFDTQAVEPHGYLPYVLGILFPGDVMPDAVILHAHGDTIGLYRGKHPERLRQCLYLVCGSLELFHSWLTLST